MGRTGQVYVDLSLCFLSKEPQLDLIRRDQGFETGLDHPGLHASLAFLG
jgi:hypothetical protein